MVQSICVLGRQPALGLAELESLFGPDKIKPIGGIALIDAQMPNIPLARLGGTIKLANVITRLDTTNWGSIESNLISILSEQAKLLPEGKLKMGLSAYEFANITPKMLERTGLTLKKQLVKNGRSTRVVPSTALELSSAQVVHNKLTGNLGLEIILIKDGTNTIVAQTTAVQDIAAYAARDQARPKRDPKTGMLPPKLAQILINLAVGKNSEFRVLDPFCGTGVILQEALLMGYSAYGTDIDPRLVEYSKSNLDWLGSKYQIASSKYQVIAADATTYHWKEAFDAVASETYLGQPLSSLPPSEQLNKIIFYTNNLHKSFLQNLYKQVKPGFRVALAVPAWKTPTGFKHLPIVDHLEELGYTRVSFVHASNSELIYHREGQIVARELLVLQRT